MGKPKTFIKGLDESQKKVASIYYEKDILFIEGPAATGKTFLASYLFLKDLKAGELDQVVVIRKDLNDLGHLPGDKNEKTAHLMEPIITNMNSIDKRAREHMDSIRLVPLSHLKGVTFSRTGIFVDEYEDLTYAEWYRVLTRLGPGSKMLFVGDPAQTEITGSCTKHPKVKAYMKAPFVGHGVLDLFHRHELVERSIKFLDNL